MVFIAADDPIFRQKRHVACAVFGGGIVLDIGRQVHVEFEIAWDNEVESLAVVEVPGVCARRGNLANDIRPHNLKQARIGGNQRYCPGWLMRLDR